MLLEQKISRIAADFAERIVGALMSAPIDELVAFSESRPPPHAAEPGRAAHAPRARRASAAKATTTPAPRASSPAEPAVEMIVAALAIITERGARGATAQQLGELLSAVGLATSGSEAAELVAYLVKSGGVRDAGFRRAAGKNATAPVYVAT